MPSFSNQFLSILFFLFFLSFISLSHSSPLSPANNVTLSGDAHFINNSIALTHQQPNCSSAVGTAFYLFPIRFLDSSTNTTASFFSRFSFRIIPSNICPFGDGFTFLIASKPDPPTLINGYMGLSEQDSDTQDSFFAVEFDTSYDPSLGDFGSNHVGIDVNSVISVASIDVLSKGIDLKSGKQMTAWIEYRNGEKMIRVWVGYSSQDKPAGPLLVSRIDLSQQFKEFMHVGFSASNSRGSAMHLVDTWRFKTYGLLSSVMPMDTVQGGDCFMCFSEDSKGSHGVFDHMDKRVSELALGLGGLAAFIIFVCTIICTIILCTMRRKRLNRRKHEEGRIFRNKVPKRLSLSEIRSATKGFNQKRIIGEGGTATVYEGSLPSCGSVAVKRFSRVNQTSPFQNQFSTEFATMVGFLRHKNLVQLQGWCCEGNELVLVYEYMANGSLDKILHKNNALSGLLTWDRRLRIVLGVASALIYLHEECERQIIHRDVKACNIMLDDEFNAKLGDFGLAEVYDHSSMIREATIPAGTVGYLAPEYVYTGVPTVKTDVYSFGVVVLEVASGKKPAIENGNMIADWMWDLWEKGKLIEGADRKLKGKFKMFEMERVLMVGLCCVHPNYEERPTVKVAARMIRGEAPLPVLPSRKPKVGIQSVLPEGSREIMSCGADENTNVDETPWLTPRTHF